MVIIQSHGSSRALTRRVQTLKASHTWDFSRFRHHCRFHDGKYPAGGFAVPNVCFNLCRLLKSVPHTQASHETTHCSNKQRLITASCVVHRIGNRPYFDRITNRGTSTMTFQVCGLVGVKVRSCVSCSHDSLLTFGAGMSYSHSLDLAIPVVGAESA